MSLIVIHAVVLALLVGFAWLTPTVAQRTVPFAVRVPPERIAADIVVAQRRRYRQWVLVGCGGVSVMSVALTALSRQPEMIPLTAFLVVGVWLLAYSRAHLAIARTKEREGWYAGQRQGVVVDTALRTSPLRFPWPWAVPALLVLAVTVLTGALRYPRLPTTLATHYAMNGQPDRYATTSVATAFRAVFVQAGFTLLLIGLAWTWVRMRADLDPRRPTASAQQHRLWVMRMSKASLALLACLNISLFLVSWLLWQSPAQTWWQVILPSLPVLGGVYIFGAVAFRSGQGGYRIPTAGTQSNSTDGLVARDDDRYWRGGLLYVNRDDPALLVPKRFGIGITLNVGNPRSWLLLAAVVAGILVVVAVIRPSG